MALITVTEDLRVTPITGVVGAYVEGVDLCLHLDDPAWHERLKELLFTFGVIAIRDQNLTPVQHKAIGEIFGSLHTHPFAVNMPEHPEILILDTTEMNKVLKWHADVTFEAEPPLASFLYAFEVPPVGGDTLFTNAQAAYEALSPEWQQRLEGLRAVHSSTATFGPQGTYKRHWDKPRHEHPDVDNTHPVVHTHPYNGRRGLYVNSQFTVAIEGMDPAESRWLLEFLWDHIASVQFQCRVQWEPGTLTIWDNRAVQHAAVPDWTEGRRFMHRVTVKGPPIE
ncbi:MAG: taurine dioxygenase [Acidimicrobiia bacterium]|nr:taurine dioxygenase [Acidimicrobiia bacterium]